MTMNKRLLLHIVLLAVFCYGWAQGPNGSETYYQGADGYKGAALKTALSCIIPIPEGRNVGYDALYDAYKKTDTRADGYVRDWYSNATNYKHIDDKAGTYKKEGDCYNREHSVPQSWFGSGGIKSDIVHVIPTDGFVNNKRSNYPLGEVDEIEYKSTNGYSKLGTCKTAGYSGTVFEPNDEIKGDMARIYFYMATCYESVAPGWGHGVFSTAYNGFEKWALDMFMRWSQQDPVDAREIARNNAVYDVQGNRNPFVDYPGLENYIWGNKKSEPFSYDNYDGTGGSGTVDPDDPQPGGDDPDPDDPQPGGDTPADCEVVLNNTFFGTNANGTIAKSNSTDLVGTANGITVTYALGTGSQRYANDSEIRVYTGNTLTVSVSQGNITELDFTIGTKNSALNSDTGSFADFKWTGNASTVVITSGGNTSLKTVAVKLSGGDALDYVLGDANSDGNVTISDAVAIVNKILGNPSAGFNSAAANVSGDFDEQGSPVITITDAVGVVNIILGNGGGASAPQVDMEEPGQDVKPE